MGHSRLTQEGNCFSKVKFSAIDTIFSNVIKLKQRAILGLRLIFAELSPRFSSAGLSKPYSNCVYICCTTDSICCATNSICCATNSIEQSFLHITNVPLVININVKLA